MPIDSRRARAPKLSPPSAGVERRQVTVDASLAGERLDKALASLAPGVSRTLARKIIGLGGVFLGVERCKVASRKVSAGDCLTITWQPERRSRPSYPLDVLHESGELIVVNKPAGQHVQGTAQGDEGTLGRELARVYGPDVQLGHRLDAPASGLMLAGRTKVSVARVMAAFRAREVRRYYLALVEGVPSEGHFRAPLLRDGRKMVLAREGDPESKSAHSEIRVLWTGEGMSLVRLRLFTGRMHQARVHLAELGSPIAGDRLYGGARHARLCLHASDLYWGRADVAELALHAPPPDDFWGALSEPGEAQSQAGPLLQD